MKMNAGAWVGIIGGGLGLVIGFGAVIATAGSDAVWIVALMAAIFGGMGFLFYKLFFQQMILSSRLQKIGISGSALITEIRDTGVTINNNPQIKLLVEIKNSLGQKYNTSIRVLLPRYNPGMYQPGMTIPVKIDPKDENKVALDTTGTQQAKSSRFGNRQTTNTSTNTFANTGTTNVDVEALRNELLEYEKKKNEILLTGVPAKAIIKSNTWLGFNIGADNPYSELELMVMPDAAPAFSAKTKGAISQQSLPKYQPGCEVFVKYDPNDTTRVTVDHS